MIAFCVTDYSDEDVISHTVFSQQFLFCNSVYYFSSDLQLFHNWIIVVFWYYSVNFLMLAIGLQLVKCMGPCAYVVHFSALWTQWLSDMEFTYNQSTLGYVKIFRFFSATSYLCVCICVGLHIYVCVCVYCLQQLLSILSYCNNHFIIFSPKQMVDCFFSVFVQFLFKFHLTTV